MFEKKTKKKFLKMWKTRLFKIWTGKTRLTLNLDEADGIQIFLNLVALVHICWPILRILIINWSFKFSLSSNESFREFSHFIWWNLTNHSPSHGFRNLQSQLRSVSETISLSPKPLGGVVVCFKGTFRSVAWWNGLKLDWVIKILIYVKLGLCLNQVWVKILIYVKSGYTISRLFHSYSLIFCFLLILIAWLLQVHSFEWRSSSNCDETNRLLFVHTTSHRYGQGSQPIFVESYMF